MEKGRTAAGDLSARLADLSPEKQAFLARKLAERQAARGAGDQQIPRRIHRDSAILSEAQETLWLYEQMHPGTAAYNIPVARRIRGEIDVTALQAALDVVVARHEALRTAITEVDGVPGQVVLPAARIALEVFEPASGDAAGRERESVAHLRAVSQAPIDLAHAPLARAVLVRLSAHEYLFVVVVHHIVFDGGSIGILLREIGMAYAAAASGRDVELPALVVQPADVAEWERATLTGERLSRELAFWRGYLDGAPGAVDLPTDFPRSGARSGPGARAAATFSATLLEQVRRLARDSESTPYMVLLSAFQALLHHYSSQQDIVVGSPIAGRSRSEVQSLIGYFASTVVVRARFDDDPTFAQLLARTRRAAIDTYEHQLLPVERLVRELGASRPRESLFDVLFVLQDARSPRLTLGDAVVEPFVADIGAAKFDLSLSMSEMETGLRAVVEYRADLFERETIERFLGHLETVIDAATRDPGARVSALPLLTVAERHQLLEAWAGPHVTYGGGDTLVELIEAQLTRAPHDIAVVHDEETVSFAALATASDVLARQLRTLGVGAGTLVGVCAERSIELVVALVAILRAGGAYVPFDPEYPRERLAFMLEDARTDVLLTTRALADTLGLTAGTLVFIDESREVSADERDIPLPSPADAAYMIYTSGSTGRPKGALNAHRGIVNRLQWMQSEYRLSAADVVLQKTPFSFDVSVWEFFWPLMAGAKLVMARPGGHRDTGYLADVITKQEVTVCHFVPSMLRAFLADPAARACTSLRDVMVSGEALPPDLVAEFHATLPGARLHNLYGPTECAVDVSYWPCPPAPVVVPIGRPVSNTRLYVLDGRRSLAPIGVPGELYLAGVQVGLGYHNRPELTAERFMRDEFAPVDAPAGATMYRTGDRARWRPDGTVEYLGRLDFQVKLRGFRIELGEIEAALLRHPMVKDAVVVASEVRSGDLRLVAYVVPAPGDAPPPAALKAFIGESLPDYMVPPSFMFMDALPLSSNGKVDRKALPAPIANIDPSAVVAPRSELEQVIAAVWRDVLGIETISVEQEFFELGGHSLLATRITAQVARIFRTTLPLRRFFEEPTVAGNARSLVALEPKPGQAAAIARLLLKAQQMSPEERERMRAGARKEQATTA